MEHWLRTILLPVLVVLVLWLGPDCAVNCEESCRTPDRRDGICRPLGQCASIKETYFATPRLLTDEEFELLKQLQCKTKDVTVCCPDEVRNHIPIRGTLPDPKAFECGLDSLADRILDGNNTAIDEFPWYALLQYRSKKGILAFKCGGSLINARYVLTAAHCLANKKIDEGETLVGVRLGEHNTATEQDCTFPETMEGCADPPQDFGIEEQIVHRGYDKNSQHQHNDIALIRLDRDASISNYVMPVCLPVEGFTPTAPNVKVTVVGFGSIGRKKHSRVKQKAMIPIFPHNECVKKFESVSSIIEQQLCAGGLFGVDSCSADSGGPMMTKRLYWVQEGVISYGNRCAIEGWPVIYTRVSSYVNWIKDNIRQ